MFPNLRKKLSGAFSAYHFFWAWAGARIHERPSEKIFVIGVTGTKGKTTTVELLNAILEAAGKRTAILSSLRVKLGEASRKNPTGNSMPGRAYIQKFLRDARAARCRYAIIEVTSQGVVQHRHRFVHWNMGLLTNLAPEHIESHGSFENYRAAKLDFLEYVLRQGGKVLLNRDDAQFEFFAHAIPGERTMEFSREDAWLKSYLPDVAPSRREAPRFLLSKFNEENIAVAVAVAKELGIPDGVIKDALIRFEGVPGRMDFVVEGSYATVVDYAHTPDSLEAAYRAMRERLDDAGEGKLICVLGAAGGGRDRWKRSEMGMIAAHYCDRIILADEDPYDEDPEKILDDVAGGIARVPYPRPEAERILDRRAALTRAVDLMLEGDIVIATGKGSEEWIHLARGKKIPWNEKEILRELLAVKSGK